MSTGTARDQQGKTGRRVVRNVMFGVASQVIGGGLFFLVTILIARHLGPESYGSFSFIFAFVAVVHMVADFGLTQILIREIARNKLKLDEILGAALPLVTMFAVAGYFVIAVSTEFFSLTADSVQAIYIMGASVLITFHAAVFAAVPRAFEKMGLNAVVLVVQRVFLFLFTLTALYLDSGLPGIALCYLGERICQWLLLRTLVRMKYSRYQWRIDITYWRYLIREGLPVGAGMVLRRISWYLDIFILTMLSTANSVGLFSVAFRVIQLVNVIPFTLSIPIFPVFSRLAVESKERVFILYERVLKIFVLISLPIAVWILILGSNVTVFMFGDAYQPAGVVLMTMGPMVIFLFLNGLYVHIFSAVDEQSAYMKAVAVAVIINVVLDIVFIPMWGIVGAALATLISEVVLFVTGAVLLSKLGPKIKYLKLFFKPIITVMISSVALLWVANAPSVLNFIFGSAAFVILYLVIGNMLQILHIDDVNVIRNVLARKKSADH